MGRYFLVLMPIVLSGCGLPPALVIGSYVADGVSYVATGKSVTDHGITEVTGRDCALLRPVFKGEPICADAPMAREHPAPVMVGENATTNVETVPVAATEPAFAPAPVRAGHRYLVLGSFSDRANAEHLANRLGGKVAVVDARAHGRAVHRVVAGPLSERELASLRSRLPGDVRPGAWEIPPVMVASAR